MTQVLLDPSNSDISLVKLAREIAMDIHPLPTILERYAISDETWAQLQSNSKFQALLGSEVEAWSTALNTHERVKLKSASMLEEWLPTLNTRMTSAEEALPAVIEAGKMLARIAGLGMPGDVNVGGMGERFVINISMGPQAEPVSFAKDVTVTPQVIDGDFTVGVKQNESD
jgi:hypothetical protein